MLKRALPFAHVNFGFSHPFASVRETQAFLRSAGGRYWLRQGFCRQFYRAARPRKCPPACCNPLQRDLSPARRDARCTTARSELERTGPRLSLALLSCPSQRDDFSSGRRLASRSSFCPTRVRAMDVGLFNWCCLPKDRLCWPDHAKDRSRSRQLRCDSWHATSS